MYNLETLIQTILLAVFVEKNSQNLEKTLAVQTDILSN